jgi:hypothetical protein
MGTLMQTAEQETNEMIRAGVNALSSNIDIPPAPSNQSNLTLIDASLLSPMIRKITDQIGKQFDERCNRMEETLLQKFDTTLRTARRSSRLCEKTTCKANNPRGIEIRKTTHTRDKITKQTETQNIFENRNTPDEIISGMTTSMV